MNLSKISDNDLKKEYYRRFTLQHNETINASELAANHARAQFQDNIDREQFLCIFLNDRNRVIKSEILFIGTLTCSAVYPREIIKKVLEYHTAAVLFVHNHPSGNPNPSHDDVKLTRKLIKACETVDVVVHDHIIIAGDKCTSFGDQGLL